MAVDGKLNNYLPKPSPLAVTDKLLGWDTTDTFYLTFTNLFDFLLSLTGLSFKEDVIFEKTIQATTAKLTNLSNGYLPKHISDVLGLGNSNVFEDASGNIGIGITPTSKLDVNGDLRVVRTIVSVQLSTVQRHFVTALTTSKFGISSYANYLSIGTNFYITSAGAYIKENDALGSTALTFGGADSSTSYAFNLISSLANTNIIDTLLTMLRNGNLGIGTDSPQEKTDVAGILRAENFKKNAFFVTKNLAASANITGATAVNIQMNASTDYEYVISPGITATLNFNDASFQYNSITMVYATGGTALKLTSPGVTFYQNGVALVADTVVGYDGTKLNEIGIKVLSSTKFLVVRG